MSAHRSRRAIATFRQRIGEAAFAEHMRSLGPNAGTSVNRSGWITSINKAGAIGNSGGGWSARRKNAGIEVVWTSQAEWGKITHKQENKK
jgi:hypothetical protein